MEVINNNGPTFFTFSSLSTGLNSVALVVLEDFIRPHCPNLRDETATRITKGISIGFGVISFASVFIISKVKTILDVREIINLVDFLTPDIRY